MEFRWRDEHIAYAWAPEPAAASGAAEDWVGGASPRKLAEAWPFANFVAPGEAFERGDLLEYEWLQARAHAHYGLRPLTEAAMHEPHLRQLYPMVLANMLRFRPARDGAPPGPNIESVGDGRYQVLNNHWKPLGKGNVEDTIRTCVAELSRAEPPPP